MPPLETMDRTIAAVLWAATGRHGEDGSPIVEAPVEIRVRLEWRYREARDEDGTPVSLVAKAVADRDIPTGSILWPGSLEEWLEVQPAQTGLMEVFIREEVRDIKGREVRREPWLRRHPDGLPEVEDS